VLDATCAADVNFCTTYMTSLAKNLTDPSNCGVDYQLGNSVVVQTYMSMLAYQTLYSASCLKDPDTSQYCFASAITNQTTWSNVYFYYLPLNISLPGSTVPTCNSCLDRTMAIYQAASAYRSQPISSTYVTAAQQVDTICGPDFANTTLPNAILSKSGAARTLTAILPQPLLMVLPLLAALHWLL
jgi:hypothetical protein